MRRGASAPRMLVDFKQQVNELWCYSIYTRRCDEIIHVFRRTQFFPLHLCCIRKPFLLIGWVWIKLHWLPPDELFDLFFSTCWLLKIKTERPGRDRLIIRIMERWQVWVTKCLFNCKWLKGINTKEREGQTIRNNSQLEFHVKIWTLCLYL